MNHLCLRNKELKFKASAKLLIILEESMQCTQINEEKTKDHNMQPVGFGALGFWPFFPRISLDIDYLRVRNSCMLTSSHCWYWGKIGPSPMSRIITWWILSCDPAIGLYCKMLRHNWVIVKQYSIWVTSVPWHSESSAILSMSKVMWIAMSSDSGSTCTILRLDLHERSDKLWTMTS